MPIVRVAITEADDDGNTITRTLTGADARRWSEMHQEIDNVAYQHGCTVDFAVLNWQEEPYTLTRAASAMKEKKEGDE